MGELACSSIPDDPGSGCAKPWGEGCTLGGVFSFQTLWNVTQNIYQSCANDSRLFQGDGPPSSDSLSLTQESCVAIAGPGWTLYPQADIWSRMTAWRFPLFQLVAIFPRPPLHFRYQLFVMLHLLGDPIDTISNLLAKLARCQQRALYWRYEFATSLQNLVSENHDREWKALAMIAEAYNEWDRADMADRVLRQLLDVLAQEPEHEQEVMNVVRQTAAMLAADRATKYLPIIAAQAIFIGAVGVAFAKTAAVATANSPSPTTFINVEAHSISFSAQYFWIIPAVILASVIGVSQTEHAIPRILQRFQDDLDRVLSSRFRLPNDFLHDQQRRVARGGLYSFRLIEAREQATTAIYNDSSDFNINLMGFNGSKSYSRVKVNASTISPKVHPEINHATTQHMFPGPGLFALLICLSGTATAVLVSFLVPPEGFDCRHIAQILILVTWLVSAAIDVAFKYLIPSHDNHLLFVFWATFWKDLVATVSTVGGVMVAHIGVFNRCSCYTNWGRTGLALPEMPLVKQVLANRIQTTYPAITFAAISFQLVFVPLYILLTNRHAVRVFLQRDHGDSNAGWLWKVNSKVPSIKISRSSSAETVPPVYSKKEGPSIADRLRRPKTFQRINSDEISLVEYPSRSKPHR